MQPYHLFPFHLSTRVVTLLMVGILGISGCNMPGAKQDSNYASQSQALSGVGSQSAGEGTMRLEYDHNFSFDYGGSNTVHMDITIKGEVPLTITQIGVGATLKCIDGETPYFQMSGSSTIPFEATADFTNGDKHCSCSLPDSIEVNILGKTYFEYLTPEIKCPQPRVALQVKEKWFTEHKWQCVCDDPDDTKKLHVEESMAMFPMVGNPELEKKTMVFPFMCPGESTLRATTLDPTGMGSGSYQWIFSSGINEGPDRYKLGPSFENWKPGMSTEPIQCFSGEWGPSLESIPQPVREWLE
jgi:hypothetical protein